MDWIYLGVLGVFVATTVGFVAFCASVGGKQ
ncbi:hypothetical protein PPN31119_02574 [Pandoraea pnomenusa]|jgi:hypothetical protein|uniref:Potassium ABC transporter ATPase n=2 Tax=Pandoraea TaxID=93217 RepID=A0A378YEG1_9BURK|nr:Uncharacterised protein [Pandoraea pnomenusa]VVE48083.1 hypothetical protein PMO31116_04477 [Pandoraea morbifera]VVE67371.1 hypothetical protein PPN31119_02574 [Pandoraea pnomenusa]